MTWNLRGRLVFSDGTMITSPNIGHKISGDVVKYTHIFTTMPTAEQWSKLSHVQTLDSNGSTGDSGYSADLFWRADSTHPMRITVTFIEEPPIVYAPEIKNFIVTRCDAAGKPNDEDNYASATLKISIGNASGLNDSTLRIYYAPNAYPIVGVSDYVDLTPRISELLSGVANNLTILPGEWSAGYSWYFAVVFTAGEESGVDTYIMPHALCSFHVAANHGGACVCGFANGTPENPMFESYATAYLYKGIHGVTNYAIEEVDTGGRWIDGRKIYRQTIPFDVAAEDTKTAVADLPAIAALVELRGFMARSADGPFLPLSFWYNDNDYNSAWVEASKLMVKTSHTVTGYAVVEYTKSSEEVGE